MKEERSGTFRLEREAVDLFKVGMREFGIGLQSGMRETLDVVEIESWTSGRPTYGPSAAQILVAPCFQFVSRKFPKPLAKPQTHVKLYVLGVTSTCDE